MSLPATITDLVASIQQTQTRMAASGGSGDSQFLKMTKQGFWAYGADETEVEEGSRWAINPNAFSTGFACWGDGELLDEAMALVTDAPIIKSELPVLAKPWNSQVGLQLACVDGEDAGTQVAYTATSVGGKKAYTALLDALLVQANSGSPDIVPIVELEVESYKHKKYGKVFTPTFKIVEWQSLDAQAAAEEDAPEAVEEVVEAEEVEEEVKPTRRRRRAS